MTTKKFYAVHGYYGTRCVFQPGQGYSVYWFDSKQERDEWVAKDDANREAVTRKDVYRILGAPDNKNWELTTVTRCGEGQLVAEYIGQ